MSLLNMHLDDISGPNRSTKIPGDSELLEDSRWLDDVVDFCRQTGLSVSTDTGAESILQKTLERGIPKGNHLIITTDSIDKRKKLYSIIVDAGVAIDCSVPRGERRADKKLQVAVLSEMKKSILTKSRKTMEPGAFEALYELTGFDLRTFSNNLEKLVTYAGDRKQITRRDVETVLHRTKQDPIFAFTNAITDKNRVEALFYMNSLLSDAQKPMRPEQVIVAVLNQIRKLLRIKEFIAGPAGRTWFAGCPYKEFNSVVMPAIQESDRALLEELQQWQDTLAGTESSESRPKERGKGKPAKPRTDLLIAKNPKNPYPVYQLFKKSEQFTWDELISAFDSLTRTDLRIKSGAENKKLILEELIINICR
jgi:DNA polymerase-3 subunit delta